MTQVQPLYRIRKLLEAIDAEQQGVSSIPGALNEQMELLIAAGTSPFEEGAKAGASYWSSNTTAVAAVVAIPTTAVMFAIYNSEDDGGMSLVIKSAWAIGVAKTAAAGQAILIGNIGQTRAAEPTNSAMTIKKMNGMGSGSSGSIARTIVGGTALDAVTGVAANWRALGPSSSFPGAAATPGTGLWAPIDGRIIVPPGRYFAMHVLADVVGSTFVGGIDWDEKQIKLG